MKEDMVEQGGRKWDGFGVQIGELFDIPIMARVDCPMNRLFLVNRGYIVGEFIVHPAPKEGDPGAQGQV